MRIEVTFTAAELGNLPASGRTAVVIDVLRATTTIVHALVNGARRVIPARTVEEAVAKRMELGRDAALLCGERDAQPIPGFDLGNSPVEFTRENVADHALIMTTTNGTPALLAAGASHIALIAAFVNVEAVAKRIVELDGDVLIACAGREGRFAMEDACCAGLLIHRVNVLRGRGVRTGDSGAAALALARAGTRDLPGTLRRTAAGRALRKLDRDADVAFCAQLNLHDVVPVFEQHRIELS
ncbi:MAG TPA: 2-phosphosulfolactate phosphatase [Longimicrobiales bacterium]